MQEYGSGISNKPAEYHEGADGGRERSLPHQSDGYQASHFTVIQQKNYGSTNKDFKDPNMSTHCRAGTSVYEATGSNHQYQNARYNSPLVPTFSSPPHSPLIGLVFDPTSQNYSGPGMTGDRVISSDRRSQSSWSINNQEPIGTGAKKKIVKCQEKRNAYSVDPRYPDKSKNDDNDRQRKDRPFNSESTSSLDFYVEGERMVSELCNITDYRTGANSQKTNLSTNTEEDRNKSTTSSDALLTALDKIIIHDQIPNQIVQLAIEACTDAENIAIAHHNRPCFKNIHSICAKTRSNVQKPDSAVANLHSQGIPWVIKNFIFSFVRILDGWKGVKELLSEKHDTFSRIENKYYSQNIRECFVQWQAVTKEMLTHIYKTFKRLDHGFTMEQKSFTHNYYATNSAAPRHQNQNKFQSSKPQLSTPRHVNVSTQQFNAIQPPWIQNQTQVASHSFNEVPWPNKPAVVYKKIPIVPPSNNLYTLNDQGEINVYHKSQYHCDPCSVREAKLRQSWTITNTPDFRNVEGICQDQRELYTQLKQKIDAELGKAPGHPLIGNVSSDLMQHKDMDLKAKMIPLSHVEKSLIPSMAAATNIRGCYVQKNNSCGDTKEEADFFATWGQMIQREPNDFLTHHSHNIQIPSNIVTVSSNISGPVQHIDPDNDEYHEISKVYMKPGSYKVPIKPPDPTATFMQNNLHDVAHENSAVGDVAASKMQIPFSSITLAPQPKYNMESWPCLLSRRTEDIFPEDNKLVRRQGMSYLDLTTGEAIDLLSSMTSDRAWEAAKQSAPKLMDFIHEGAKSNTARLYDALGLCSNYDYSESLSQSKLEVDNNENSSNCLSSIVFNSKETNNLWNQRNSVKNEYVTAKSKDNYLANNEIAKSPDDSIRTQNAEDQTEVKKEDAKYKKGHPRCPSFDRSGNYVRDDNQKKPSGKSKVAASGTWYHPKKKKPLSVTIVKKFDNIIAKLLETDEALFIQHDMDIKMAPRFYEVVKYPMCLHDISTKLKSSSYTDYDQVVQDFRRIFNNVRLYLKSYPDSVMKKNVNKTSADFERNLNEEFQNKCDSKIKSAGTKENQDNNKKKDEKEFESKKTETNHKDSSKKDDHKNSGDDKK